MKVSAGILFIHEKDAILAHSTGAPWFGSWMPPKGGVDEGETLKQAAIRETEEEIGIRVSHSLLNRSFDVDYIDKK
jgi:8-oxo-dGTP diphosphatase